MNIKKLIGLPSFPKVAGTIKEFRDWDIKMKKEYPTKYKIHRCLEKMYRRLFLFPSWRWRDMKYWVLYRIHPKHTYTSHKLTTLKPGYYDTDILILHFAFEKFAEFMKFQLSDKAFVTWEYSKDMYQDWQLKDDLEGVESEIKSRNATWAEMKDLYHWWTEIYPNLEDELPDYPTCPKEWGSMAVLNDDYKDTPEVKDWRRVCDIRSTLETKWKQDETDNLIRLAKIRNSLWD